MFVHEEKHCKNFQLSLFFQFAGFFMFLVFLFLYGMWYNKTKIKSWVLERVRMDRSRPVTICGHTMFGCCQNRTDTDLGMASFSTAQSSV
jgi:hypothetical protein